MFKIERVSSNRLDIEMDGKLDSAEMTNVLDELIEKAEGIENGILLYDIIEYHLPTFSAFTIELKRMPELLRLISRFQRAAVLTDKSWLKTISELEGKLMPDLEIRAFDRDERAAAERWMNCGS